MPAPPNTCAPCCGGVSSSSAALLPCCGFNQANYPPRLHLTIDAGGHCVGSGSFGDSEHPAFTFGSCSWRIAGGPFAPSIITSCTGNGNNFLAGFDLFCGCHDSDVLPGMQCEHELLTGGIVFRGVWFDQAGQPHMACAVGTLVSCTPLHILGTTPYFSFELTE